MRILIPSTLAILASAAGAQVATYAEYGHGCNGEAIVTAYALNDVSPALQVTSVPNEYGYPVINTAAVPVQVLGFEVFTRSNNVLNTEIGNAGIFRDNAGAGSLVHTLPAFTGEATGVIEVTGTAGWYSVAVSPPVIVQPGEAFWVQLDAYSKIAPPQHTSAGGVNSPATIHYRRPTLNSYAWTPSVSVFRPQVRVLAASLTSGVGTLVHTSLPVSGQNFTLEIRNGPAFFPALAILAFSDTSWLGGFPLPADLGIFGAPNCTTFTSADEFHFVLLDGAGTGTWSITIPGDPFFLGVRFFNQGAILGAPNQLGAYVTNAGRARIGT